MPIRTLQTFEQFEKFQDDGMKHELLQGEHIVSPPAKSHHSTIQHRLMRLLWPYVDQHQLGDVRIETGFKLTSDTWLQPDVSFLRAAHIQATPPNRYYEGAPAIAIEVVSESNTPARLEIKTKLYLAHGSEEVWIVYPTTRNLRICYANGSSKTVGEGELLSDLFPGWSVAVDSIFRD